MPESLEKALALGYERSRIICMQGPFSEAVKHGDVCPVPDALCGNQRFRCHRRVPGKRSGCAEDRGETGGYCQESGAGHSYQEVLQKLQARYGAKEDNMLQVKVIGIGPGNPELLTGAAQQR
jgi:hypothetical protein